MARKDSTPKPPRRVQAPQQRRGSSTSAAGADALQRQRLLLYAIAGSGILALVVVIAIVLLGGGSGTASAQNVLTSSGCTLQTVEAVTNKPDHSDVPTPDTKVKWNTFPPSNGPHYGTTIIYGSYDEPLQQTLLLHNLEHGGVSVQWGSKVPAADVEKIRAWYADDPDGLVLAPLPALGDKIALAAWQDPTPGEGNKGFGRVAKCTSFDKKSFDAFLDAYAFQGPEPFPRDALAPGGN